MITVVINGQSFDYPEVGDTEWGDAATNAFKVLAATTLQKIGGSFTLQNDLVFGGGKGVHCLFFSSSNSDPSQSGVYRLCNGELVAWRNGNNDNDDSISFDASDNFVINGNTISFDVNGEMLVNGVQVTRSGEIVNADIAAAAGIEESKLALDYSTDSLNTAISNHISNTSNPHSVTKSQVLTGDLIVNADVDNSAAIAESKLSLDYSTSSLNTDIGNVSGDLTNHTSNTSNPHSVTKSQVLTGDLIVNADVDNSASISESKLSLDYSTSSLNTNITNHTSNTSNPHSVTKAQILTGDLIVNSDVDSSAAIAESKLSLDYSTSSLNSSITSHTGDTNNPHNTKLTNLGEVSIDPDTLADGDALIYDDVDDVFKNDSSFTNHIGDLNNPHNTTLAKLTDVYIDTDTLADGDIISYDYVNSQWKNTTNGGGGGDSRFANVAGAYLTDYKKYLGVSKKPCILKAGSYIRLTFHKDDIVIDPSGTETTLSADLYLDITNLAAGEEFFIFYSPSHNEFLYAKRADMVEKNSEPAFSTNTIWFNYITKIIKAGKGATSWSDTTYTDLTVPLCIIKNQKIIELFDYFGSYFLDYYWIFPNTKYLRPQGRNSDGSYKNSEATINSGNIYQNSANTYYKGNKYPVGSFNNGTFSNIADHLYKFIYIDDEIPAGYDINVYQNGMYGFYYAFSYVDNSWFYMSSGTVLPANFDILIFVTLNTAGEIIKLDKPPVLTLENKFLENRPTKNEDVYYSDGGYIQDKTPISSNIILSVNDNRNNIIETASACNIVLPCAGIKKGDKYSFLFINNPSGNVVIQSFSRATINTVTTSDGGYEYCYVAKRDLPSLVGDWYGYKKAITTFNFS